MFPIETILRALCSVIASLICFTTSAQLTANFSSDINSGCSPLVVHFQDQSTGNPTSWNWNLGNGTISQQQNPTATFFSPGTYNVKLVIKNISGTDSIVKNQFITVRANPSVAFLSSDSSGCFPKTIQFTDNSTPGSGTITQWTWDFGDGNVSNQQNPIHTYTQAGSYTPTLKVINSFGCSNTITKLNFIRLSNTVADFSFINSTPCQLPANVSFSNLSLTATSYQWNFGDGITSTIANPIHTYSVAGNYSVQLIAFSNSGCTDTIVRQIAVGKPTTDFSIPSPSCVGTPMTFQNISASVPVSAIWKFSDGSTISAINATKTFTAPGNYQATLISNFGNCADTITRTFVINPQPSVSFLENGDLGKCSPVATVSFTNATNNANTYLWSFGDGATSSAVNPSHNYSDTGRFSVKLVAINEFGCSDSITKADLVKISPPKITDLTGVPFVGCAPHTVNMGANVNSPEVITTWQWNFGDGNTSNTIAPSHTYSTPGVYNVSLIIKTIGGCSDTLIYPAAVTINNKPHANFDATPLQVCASDSVQFHDLSTGANQWLWIFNDGSTSTEQNPYHHFADTGVFSIKLVAFSNTGCIDSFIIPQYIKVIPPVAGVNLIRTCDNPFNIQFRDSSVGGVTYKWLFGDGDSSVIKNSVHTYSSTGNYNYSLTITEGGCSSTYKGSVRVIDEHPSLNISDTILCRLTQATFAAGNINASNISMYKWSYGDGNSDSLTTSTITYNYNVAGTYHPSLITTDINGCKDTASGVITSKIYGPKADFQSVDGACVNSNVAFGNSSVTDGVHNIVQWQFNFGDGNIQTFSSAPLSHTFSSAGTYDISLKVKDSYGCYDSVTKSAVIVITDPVAAFASSDSVKCKGSAVQLSNNSSGVDLTYTWQFGDGNTSATIDPAHAYSGPGTYNITLIATDKYGCKDTLSKQQTVANPTAAFTANDSISTCPPLLVSLTNQSTNTQTLSWNFGDGGNSVNQNPSHYYTTPGTYKLKLYVNGYGNCSDSSSKTIIIKGPSGNFSFSPGSICTNGTIDFHANTREIVNLIWDFSDGIINSTTDSIVAHTYSAPGFYIPKLILIDTAGCQVPITSPDTIKVLGVRAKVGVNQKLFCDSANVQFADSSIAFNDLPSTYLWKFGDGATSTIANPAHNYTSPGLYSVSLVIATQSGCIDSAKLTTPITIVKSPQININSRPAVCLNDTITFYGQLSAIDTSALRWNWNFGNGSIASVQNANTFFTNTGNQQVTAIATNNSGCSDTASISILVHPLPDLNAGTDTMICRGQLYTLQPTGAAVYIWQNDPTLSCTTCANPVTNTLVNKTYYVKGFSQFGCLSNDSVTVGVMQPFSMKVSNSDTLCEGDKAQLIAGGAANYSWFPSSGLNNSSISNPVANPSITTNYQVIGSDAKNCFKDTGYITLVVYPIPQFNIADDIITLAAGSTATIRTSSSSDITHWKWYPSKDLNCADCPQPIVTAKDNITYRAEAWNDGGCATTDKVTISVICNDGNVFIPNTFSPNDDGMNDVFYVRGKGINYLKSFKVFNRWGEPVFEKHDCNANDISAGWNGTLKNAKLTPDVYVYIVDVVCSNNTVFTLKGNVTLIR